MHDCSARYRAQRVAAEPADCLRVFGRARADRRADAHGRLRGGVSALKWVRAAQRPTHDGRLLSGSVARRRAAFCADRPHRLCRARVRCDRGCPLVSPNPLRALKAVKTSIRRPERRCRRRGGARAHSRVCGGGRALIDAATSAHAHVATCRNVTYDRSYHHKEKRGCVCP